MAMADYYSCDVCGCKCFYDANLNWSDSRPFVNGMFHSLDNCGDIAALCIECTKTHEIRIVPIEKDSLQQTN